MSFLCRYTREIKEEFEQVVVAGDQKLLGARDDDVLGAEYSRAEIALPGERTHSTDG